MSIKLDVEPKKILSVTNVILTMAETLFETGGQSCKVLVIQDYLGKTGLKKTERSLALFCGQERICSGPTLVNMLNQLCDVVLKNNKKIPISKLKEASVSMNTMTFKGAL